MYTDDIEKAGNPTITGFLLYTRFIIHLNFSFP